MKPGPNTEKSISLWDNQLQGLSVPADKSTQVKYKGGYPTLGSAQYALCRKVCIIGVIFFGLIGASLELHKIEHWIFI